MINLISSLVAVITALMFASCPGRSEKPQIARSTQDLGRRTNGENSLRPPSSSPETGATSSEEEERGRSPADDEIAEDCVAFLRSTKSGSPNGSDSDCPQCPARTEGKEVLTFRRIEVVRKNCFDSACDVYAVIHAGFNSGGSGNIVGGLTGWISPEQRKQYAEGQPSANEQVYRVKISYRRDQRGWRAIEFDRG